jgi:aspartate/methionine/tyrosine aminotransferase
MAQRRKFTILYDDTYAHLLFAKGDHSALQILRDSVGDRFVILGTASKSYCMTGWRIGWVLGPRPLVEACAALASHSTQGPATFAQVAAVEALSGLQKFVQGLAGEYRRRRDFLHPVVAAIPKVSCVEPEGGFYLFPNVARYLRPEMPTTVELADRLLDEKGVAVVPGEGFGTPGYLRISFARSSDELKDGSRRIVSFFASLRGETV